MLRHITLAALLAGLAPLAQAADNGFYLGARLEYESFPVGEDSDLGTVSLSFIYTFF